MSLPVIINADKHHVKCGLSASESSLKMQDDLATLFARQLTVGNVPSTAAQKTSDAPTSSCAGSPSSIVYSITQHYHHSSHQALRPAVASHLLPVDVSDTSSVLSANEILKQHNINPLSLSPSQLSLFQHAEKEQQSRLIQMWQILHQNASNGSMEATTSTCAELEDQQQGTQFAVSENHQQGFQGTVVQDLDMDGQSREDNCDYAEPYMISGYEALAQRDYNLSAVQSSGQLGYKNVNAVSPLPNGPTTGSSYNLATDAVYESRGLWERTTPEPIEHQYGAFEQMSRFPGCGLVAAHWLNGHGNF